MYKLIFLLTRKEGTTREQFREYYETVHRHFIKQMPGAVNYLRRYVEPVPPLTETGVEFDCITEVWFENFDSFQAAQAATSTREFRKAVADDEDNFINRQNTRVFTVVEQSW